jgi:DNA primase
VLNRESWYPQAAGLDVGQKLRVKHDCGSDRILLVSRDDRGYHAFCFRCNEPGHAPPPQESLADKLARMARQRAADVAASRPELPEPRVYGLDDWPVKARLWLYRAGLGRDRIGELGAYYHPPSDRVVLPVLSGGVPVFWQARAVDGRVPKYLAPSVDRSRVIPRYGSAANVTLTEDILSAYKVGIVGEGWALMGTRVSDHALSRLLVRGTRVNVWMDNDLPPLFPVNRGQIAAAKIGKQLRAAGLEVRNIISPRDPKLMHADEIKELLCPTRSTGSTGCCPA